MKPLPTQLENETGLNQRYYIQKVVRQHVEFMGEPCEDQLVLKEVDPSAEYFVMRLDTGGKDQKHIDACRIGVNSYAKAIADHLPELSKDLMERYPPSTPPAIQEGEDGQITAGFIRLCLESAFGIGETSANDMAAYIHGKWVLHLKKRNLPTVKKEEVENIREESEVLNSIIGQAMFDTWVAALERVEYMRNGGLVAPPDKLEFIIPYVKSLSTLPSTTENKEPDWFLIERAYCIGFLNRTDMMQDVDGLKERLELAKSFLKTLHENNNK